MRWLQLITAFLAVLLLGLGTYLVVLPENLEPASVQRGALSEKIFLAQNNPNPFTDSTQIYYYLPDSTMVNLTVLSGMERLIVDTLVNRIQAPGWHNITFEAENLPHGTYQYRLDAGENSRERNMRFMPLYESDSL